MSDNTENRRSCIVLERETTSPVLGPVHPSRKTTVLFLNSGIMRSRVLSFTLLLFPLFVSENPSPCFVAPVIVACFQSVISVINNCLPQLPCAFPGPLGSVFQFLLRSTDNVFAFLLQFLCMCLSSFVTEHDFFIQVLNLLSQRASFPFGLLDDAIGLFDERRQEVVSNVD